MQGWEKWSRRQNFQNIDLVFFWPERADGVKNLKSVLPGLFPQSAELEMILDGLFLMLSLLLRSRECVSRPNIILIVADDLGLLCYIVLCAECIVWLQVWMMSHGTILWPTLLPWPSLQSQEWSWTMPTLSLCVLPPGLQYWQVSTPSRWGYR